MRERRPERASDPTSTQTPATYARTELLHLQRRRHVREARRGEGRARAQTMEAVVRGPPAARGPVGGVNGRGGAVLPRHHVRGDTLRLRPQLQRAQQVVGVRGQVMVLVVGVGVGMGMVVRMWLPARPAAGPTGPAATTHAQALTDITGHAAAAAAAAAAALPVLRPLRPGPERRRAHVHWQGRGVWCVGVGVEVGVRVRRMRVVGRRVGVIPGQGLRVAHTRRFPLDVPGPAPPARGRARLDRRRRDCGGSGGGRQGWQGLYRREGRANAAAGLLCRWLGPGPRLAPPLVAHWFDRGKARGECQRLWACHEALTNSQPGVCINTTHNTVSRSPPPTHLRASAARPP